ncbi:hypothetical protein [Desulfovibrio sp.]|uniref:hypothetical protein n=2 Tax=Desulfovibrio sp. TaxID=885 RepID=UPI00307C6AB6
MEKLLVMPHSGGLKNLSGTVGETTLTVEQLAAHNHQIPFDLLLPLAGSSVNKFPKSGSYGQSTDSTGGSQPHTHTLSGASGAADSLPPYYALALIMRIA